ncbi:MAG TPA: alpha/beta hydrolase-fold protein [Chloroflexota bacterium]|nr:alpha/beta hydrolase-fold protein [Chloroflexota bacterium]
MSKPMTSAVQPFIMPYAEAFDITSSAGPSFRISVGFPPSYASSDRQYPVLYVLDAHSYFATVLEIARLRPLYAEIEELVVVGIGYPLSIDLSTYGARRPIDDELIAGARRTYDFSTAEWDLSTPLGRVAKGVFAALGQPVRLGGAPALLDFISDDLQPLINERYRVDPANQGLFGDSAGGNFVGYALFRRPEAFAKYICVSPGFAYNDWEVFRLEEEYAAGHDDLPVTLYLAAGSNEMQQMAIGELVSGTARMAEKLYQRGYPNLRLTTEILPGKTHLTATTDALHRGLEVCWPGSPAPWDAALIEKALRPDTGVPADPEAGFPGTVANQSEPSDR